MCSYLCRPLLKKHKFLKLFRHFEEENFEIVEEIFWIENKGSYLCSPFKKEGGKKGRKFFERLKATVRKSSIYGKV